MSERDKFLTEAMGYAYSLSQTFNDECGFDFSTWEGFGKLAKWVKVQEFKLVFFGFGMLKEEYVDPDRFADSVYKYLKGETK
jgi:hypothetical protein